MTYPPQDPGTGAAPPPAAPPPPPAQAPPGYGVPPQTAPPGYGAPPGYPPAYPAYGGPGGPPPTNKLGRGKTIGIVLGAVGLLAVGGVGAAVAFGGGDDGGSDLPPNAGQPTETAPATPAASPGATATPTGAATTPAPSGTLSPSPVASGSPPPPPPPPPTEPPGPPVPNPTDSPAPGGDSIQLSGGVVTVPVPAPWQASVSDDGTQVSMWDDNNDFMWVGVFNADPSASAAAIIAENRETLVLGENFSGLEFGEIKAQPPFGSVVSMATIPYRGVWTDSQASFELGGLLWVAVRQDGSVLVMTTEATPPSAWAVESFAPILDGALNSFAGTG